jgi:hypothetical protein
MRTVGSSGPSGGSALGRPFSPRQRASRPASRPAPTPRPVGRRRGLLGQSLLPVVNALLLGSLLYRSRLVPRIIPLVGLIGAPLLLTSDAGVLFGLWPRVSAVTAIGALPIAVWEFSLGVHLVANGFRPSPITDAVSPADNRPRTATTSTSNH